jgi:hypothetical protein
VVLFLGGVVSRGGFWNLGLIGKMVVLLGVSYWRDYGGVLVESGFLWVGIFWIIYNVRIYNKGWFNKYIVGE